MNNVHEDIKDLVSVIITLGANLIRGGTVFSDGVIYNELGKIPHVLKHLIGRCVVGTFERYLYEGYIWRGHIVVI